MAARATDHADDAGNQLELAESLSTAFLVVLEQLSPAERAAFVLREVFDYPYAEVAAALDKSEAACRQLVHRAKQAVAARRPRFPATPDQQRLLTQRFVDACAGGDMSQLLAILTDDAVVVSDGGGLARAAARPVAGADKVARFLLGVVSSVPTGAEVALRTVNGGPGIVVALDGSVATAVTLDCSATGIETVHIITNPQKLTGVHEG